MACRDVRARQVTNSADALKATARRVRLAAKVPSGSSGLIFTHMSSGQHSNAESSPSLMRSKGCTQKRKRTASIGPVSPSRRWAAGLRAKGISTPTGFYNKAWGRRDNGAPQENTHKTQ